jgi:hypothetical protein
LFAAILNIFPTLYELAGTQTVLKTEIRDHGVMPVGDGTLFKLPLQTSTR